MRIADEAQLVLGEVGALEGGPDGGIQVRLADKDDVAVPEILPTQGAGMLQSDLLVLGGEQPSQEEGGVNRAEIGVVGTLDQFAFLHRGTELVERLGAGQVRELIGLVVANDEAAGRGIEEEADLEGDDQRRGTTEEWLPECG